MVKLLDCGLKVSEFEFQTCNYIHFWTNAPWEWHEPSYPPVKG